MKASHPPIPIDQQSLVAQSFLSPGTPDLVRLIEVDDDHPLHATVQSGELATLVRQLFDTDLKT